MYFYPEKQAPARAERVYATACQAGRRVVGVAKQGLASNASLYPALKRLHGRSAFTRPPVKRAGAWFGLRQTVLFGKGITITPLCREKTNPRHVHPYCALCALERSESNQHKAQPPTARKGGGFTSFSLLTRPRSGAVTFDAYPLKASGGVAPYPQK